MSGPNISFFTTFPRAKVSYSSFSLGIDNRPGKNMTDKFKMFMLNKKNNEKSYIKKDISKMHTGDLF